MVQAMTCCLTSIKPQKQLKWTCWQLYPTNGSFLGGIANDFRHRTRLDDMRWHDMTWHDMTWHGMLRCDEMRWGKISFIYSRISCSSYISPMMTSSNGSISALLALCEGNHRSLVDSPHKGQRRGALMCSVFCAWRNGRVNNRDAEDLRRHHVHYDVTDVRDLFTDNDDTPMRDEMHTNEKRSQ